MGDAGTCLVFKLLSGTHRLNEEFGRHRGREGKCMCNLCGEDLCGIVPFIQYLALFLEHLKII